MTNYPTVLITDETLRDGLQIEREGVTLDEKFELLEKMVDAGLSRMVVGAFVNPKWSPQMADSLELVKRLKARPGVSFYVLALNERGRVERLQHSPPVTVEPIQATHLHIRRARTYLVKSNSTCQGRRVNRGRYWFKCGLGIELVWSVFS